jgi:hypothetical protein
LIGTTVAPAASAPSTCTHVAIDVDAQTATRSAHPTAPLTSAIASSSPARVSVPSPTINTGSPAARPEGPRTAFSRSGALAAVTGTR